MTTLAMKRTPDSRRTLTFHTEWPPVEISETRESRTVHRNNTILSAVAVAATVSALPSAPWWVIFAALFATWFCGASFTMWKEWPHAVRTPAQEGADA